MHVHECKMHARARADHVAACGGWKGAVKASTGSWDGGKDPGGAHWSCGETKVYRSGLEKIGAEDHRRTENDAMARGEKRPEEAD